MIVPLTFAKWVRFDSARHNLDNTISTMAKTSGAGTRGSPADSPPRFTGKLGKHRLLERLRAQTLVAGDSAIASALMRAGRIVTFAKGDTLIHQGTPENEKSGRAHG